MSGHHSASALTHTWLTPKWVIDALGCFDLDPCAAPSPRPWATANTSYEAPLQNGLGLPWFGRVWLNPPYGNQASAWLQKLVRHGRGTALIFARTETSSFFSDVWGEADALLFLRGRLFFHRPDGSQAALNAGAPSVLCAYGRDDAEILHGCGLEGTFVGLKRPVLLHMALVAEPPAPAWREVVEEAIAGLGGSAKLSQLYEALESHPKVAGNSHWREKIRQTVSRIGLPKIGAGQYSLGV